MKKICTFLILMSLIASLAYARSITLVAYYNGQQYRYTVEATGGVDAIEQVKDMLCGSDSTCRSQARIMVESYD